MRPAVMDDGIGGRIVGWRDADLVAAELGRWEAAQPVPVTRVASPPPPLPMVARSSSARPIVAPPAALPARPIVAPPAPPIVVAVAPKAEEPEDDWEWTIALARARAVAEEVELAVAPLAKPVSRRTRQDTVPPPPVMRTQPMAVVAAPASSTPHTIIPVPQLPVMKSPPRFEPVVRSSSMGAPHALPALPRRMAKGTGPVLPRASDTQQMLAVGDRTETSIELADQTRQTVLPPVARPR